jgi:hypothetical protein
MIKKRELTEHQTRFLEALGGEAKGDVRTAIRLAGYAENTSINDITKSLKEEILEVTMNLLALNAPKAAFGLLELLTDPNSAGATTKLKVIQDLLNRVGAATRQEDIQLKVPSGGLFIMPAKGAQVELEAPVIDITPNEVTTE